MSFTVTVDTACDDSDVVISSDVGRFVEDAFEIPRPAGKLLRFSATSSVNICVFCSSVHVSTPTLKMTI